MRLEISNPHDRFFRETFSRTEIARDFLRNYLPEEVSGLLDFSSLELRKDSFVDPDLRQHFSDLLYKVDLQEVELAQAVRTAFPKKVGGAIMSTLAEKWMERGLEQGLEQATRNSVIETLEIRFGSVPEEIVAAVDQIHDLDALKSLFRQAVTVDSLATFSLYLQETNH